jgi:hypothetical protein
VTLYSVFERSDEIAPAVVPEKFSWLAALLPPVYALVHGLWLGLLLYVSAVVILGLAGLWVGAEAGFWLYVLLAVLIGFEAAGFRRAKLRAKGWTYRSELIAGAEDLAQRDWLAGKPQQASAA